MSRHPDLNGYIRDLIANLVPWIEKGILQRIVFVILDSSNVPLERFLFDVELFPLKQDENEENLELLLRSLILKLSICDALLSPLPQGCLFISFKKG